MRLFWYVALGIPLPPLPMNTERPLRLFYSYSHKDEALLKKLKDHLEPMKRDGLIMGWHDREIVAGTDWRNKIDENLEKADIVLLLVSRSFMGSDYCYDIEMSSALDRHNAGGCRRDCRHCEGGGG